MSGPPRFFISHDHVIDRHITISGEDVRHIATVLRMKTGDELLLCDGQGTEYAVKIIRLDPSRDEIQVVTSEQKTVREPMDLIGMVLSPG